MEGSDYTEKKSMIADFEKVFDSVYVVAKVNFSLEIEENDVIWKG